MLACVVRGQMIENERKEEPAAIVDEVPAAVLPWEREEEPVLV
jgi:hypothetical protein